MKRIWIKVLLGIAGAIVLAVVAVFYFTSGITKVGDDFFAAASTGDMDRAYNALSDDFRAGTTQAEMAAYLAAHGMDNMADTSWSSRSIQASSSVS